MWKSIMFVVLMVFANSSYSYSKGDWQLILTIVAGGHSSIATAPFGQHDACMAAGNRWVQEHNKLPSQLGGRQVFFVCALTYDARSK